MTQKRGALAFAYNTNGLQLHSGADAVYLVADLGYEGIELSLYPQHCDLLYPDRVQRQKLAVALEKTGLRRIISAGVPLVLSSDRFEPTLFHPTQRARARRKRFLKSAIDLAHDLHAECVVFNSGYLKSQVSADNAWSWLCEGVYSLALHATRAGVPLALEPEPEHFIETLADYRRLRNELNCTSFGLALDVGHLFVSEDQAADVLVSAALRRDTVLHVQIEDIQNRQHRHLPFGEGDISFEPIIKAFADGGYQGLISVELSRHSHVGVEQAKYSLEFLRRTLERVTGEG